jgi:hypothetical protein
MNPRPQLSAVVVFWAALKAGKNSIFNYSALPKSHAEKNFGVISITTSLPFLD